MSSIEDAELEDLGVDLSISLGVTEVVKKLCSVTWGQGHRFMTKTL